MLLLLTCQIYGQKNPIDTTFYANGAIKSILFKSDWVFPGNSVNVYYKLDCLDKKKLVRSVDSAKGWIKEVRTYYKDSTFTRKHYGETFSNLNGIAFHLESYEPRHISIYIGTNQDSLITTIGIQSAADNDRNVPLRTNKNFLWIDYKIPTEIEEIAPVLLEEGSIEMTFYKKSFVKQIIYRRPFFKDNSIWLNTQYLFYPDNKLKCQGTYRVGYGRSGNWYYYNKNGTLSSEGQYFGSTFNEKGDEIRNIKSGNWKYYDENGCPVKEEIWNEGILIKTSDAKKKNKRENIKI